MACFCRFTPQQCDGFLRQEPGNLLVWLLVFTFPAEEFRLMSGVLKPDYSMMKTTVTCNKIKQSIYEERVKSVTGTKILSHAI